MKTACIRLIVAISLALGIMILTIGCDKAQKTIGTPYMIEITPESIVINVGQSKQYSAIVRDVDGNEIPASVTLSISPESLGTIDSKGLFTANKNGEGKIEARSDALYGYTNIIVTKNDVLSFDITGYSIKLFDGYALDSPYVNDIIRFDIVCKDGNKNIIYNIDPSLISWSGTPEIADYISPGIYYIKKDGTLNVTASYKDVEGGFSLEIPKIIRITAEADAEVGYRISDGLGLGPWPDSLGGGYSSEYGYYWYGFIKFHFPSTLIIPGFNSAKMKIYGKALWNNAPVGWVDVHENAANWEESTITYDSMPPKGDLVVTPEFDLVGNYKWYEIDVTDLVGKWISGQKNNYGLRVENTRCSESNSIGIETRTSINYPRILVNY